ncbi:hypothetical protein FHX82_005335 [Amycolatopsis bartoniae]|uniref:DUF6286 domain-containing protein n=1 Tax=Amycolatopsis bartoniae TaxID=941986 RepID=A0A8H9IMZ2_9PSEU|nr:DUF6286 domain-containing protein [Amycolatopsis bartoniae]MBB2938259.1 hypothetical protein [Amycolatopsis bartoniae]TVT09033.1 hypothetical protein FNH07_10370 [Amycolatopsis bartoniae]GHF33854.1 hypothetical protein GCM10017566_03130 [Amycolatopsis bartoniae]
MIRRSRRSLPATVVALVGLALCALVATSAVQLLLHKSPVLDYARAAGFAHRTQWSDLPVVIGGGVLAALGLLLLAGALLPGRALVLPLGDERVPAGAGARSMAAVLRSAAESVEGVDSAKLKLRRKKVTARVAATRLASEDLAERVRAALEDQLDRIGPAVRPSTRVRIS